MDKRLEERLSSFTLRQRLVKLKEELAFEAQHGGAELVREAIAQLLEYEQILDHLKKFPRTKEEADRFEVEILYALLKMDGF